MLSVVWQRNVGGAREQLEFGAKGGKWSRTTEIQALQSSVGSSGAGYPAERYHVVFSGGGRNRHISRTDVATQDRQHKP